MNQVGRHHRTRHDNQDLLTALVEIVVQFEDNRAIRCISLCIHGVVRGLRICVLEVVFK